MRRILSLVFVLGLASCANTSHKIASHDSHIHGKDCGHNMVKHGNHSDFLHDNEYHHQNDQNVVTFHGKVEMKKSNRKLANVTANHSNHVEHGQKCGHEFVTHGSGETAHLDYIVSDSGVLIYEDEHNHFHGEVGR